MWSDGNRNGSSSPRTYKNKKTIRVVSLSLPSSLPPSLLPSFLPPSLPSFLPSLLSKLETKLRSNLLVIFIQIKQHCARIFNQQSVITSSFTKPSVYKNVDVALDNLVLCSVKQKKTKKHDFVMIHLSSFFWSKLSLYMISFHSHVVLPFPSPLFPSPLFPSPPLSSLPLSSLPFPSLPFPSLSFTWPASLIISVHLCFLPVWFVQPGWNTNQALSLKLATKLNEIQMPSK